MIGLEAPPVGTAVSRPVLVASLDSTRQSRSWRADPVGARLEAVGHLRTAVLLGDVVLLTHAQVLDGVALLELGPQGVAEALGTTVDTLPLRISCPDGDLRAAAEQMAAAPGFVWSSREAHGADPAAHDDELDARLARLRRRWVEAAADHGLTVVRPSGFDLPAALARGPVRRLATAYPDVVGALRTELRRSGARRLLESAAEVPADDRRALLAWWSQAYAEAIASQHGAVWLEVPADDVPPESVTDHGAFPIRGDVLGRLGAMPPAVFATARYATRDARARVAAAGTRRRRARAVRDLAYVVLRVDDVPDRRRAVLRAWSLLATATVLSVGGFLVDRVEHASGPALAGAAVLVLLQGAPWDAVGALLEARRGRMRAVVHVG